MHVNRSPHAACSICASLTRPVPSVMTTNNARCRCHSQDLYDEIGDFWDLIVVFCFLLVLILVPLDSVMPRPESRISGLFWMINVVFFVDALLVSMRFKVPPAATSMKVMCVCNVRFCRHPSHSVARTHSLTRSLTDFTDHHR